VKNSASKCDIANHRNILLKIDVPTDLFILENLSRFFYKIIFENIIVPSFSIFLKLYFCPKAKLYQKSKFFLSKIKNFGQKSKFMSEIQVFIKKLLSKIDFLSQSKVTIKNQSFLCQN